MNYLLIPLLGTVAVNLLLLSSANTKERAAAIGVLLLNVMMTLVSIAMFAGIWSASP